MVNFYIFEANFLEPEMFINSAIWTIYEYMHFLLDNYDYWWISGLLLKLLGKENAYRAAGQDE